MPYTQTPEEIETRKTILKLVGEHPLLRKKKFPSGAEGRQEWEKLREEVFRATNQRFDVDTLKKYVSTAKDSLYRKLKIHIAERKPSQSRAEVEEKICEWKYYDSFKYYREELKEEEDQFWATGSNGIVQRRIAAPVAAHPIAIVICPNNQLPNLRHPKVTFVGNYTSSIPTSCPEAILAQQHGSLELEKAKSFPGIPSKKFQRADEALGNDGTKEWPLQVAFKNTEVQGEKWIVYYEGWALPDYISESDLKKNEFVWAMTTARDAFFNKLRDVASEEEKDQIESWQYIHHLSEKTSHFWLYQDMSYFHTKAQLEFGQGPVMYMSLKKNLTLPPRYQFTTINIIDQDAYETCIQHPANKTIQELVAANPHVTVPGAAGPGCENPRGCVCNLRHKLLYKGTQNLQTKDGVIDFGNLKENKSRIIVECSNECGCSSSCPRRHLQRGQQKPMMVFHEENKGFTLHAGADIATGEYIGEYTGCMKFFKDGEDHSYEAEINIFHEDLVICARTTGNAIRFLSHSCEPNAVFVPVHSRRLESDPLLPKIAAFALKPIKLGDEMTISYYKKSQLRNVTKKNSIPCRCNAPSCLGKLPTK